MKNVFWETVNKIIYSPVIKETIATMAQKSIAEFEQIYHYFARLRQMDASPGKALADPVSWQSKIDSDTGDWWIRNKDNTDWIKFATININGGGGSVEHAKEADIANKTKGALMIQKNGADLLVDAFNGSKDQVANVLVPTRTSELINDSDFATIGQVNAKPTGNMCAVLNGSFNIGMYTQVFTAPLPSGFTESQCKFYITGSKVYDVGGGESTPDTIYISQVGRTVSLGINERTANGIYMVWGVK